MEAHRGNGRKRRRSERGVTILETMIAITILLIACCGVLGLSLVAMTTTENHGHLGARTTEYAQDKMEQLLALQFGDGSTDTTTFPAGNCGAGCGLTPGGSSDPNNAVAPYVDYLDANGNLLGSGGGVGTYYTRVWQITVVPGNPHLKQITVSSNVSSNPMVPTATVTSLKADPF